MAEQIHKKTVDRISKEYTEGIVKLNPKMSEKFPNYWPKAFPEELPKKRAMKCPKTELLKYFANLLPIEFLKKI